MLKVIPKSAAAFCVEGVIPASATASANSIARVEAFARKKAARIVEQAHVEADALRKKAAADGFFQAYVDVFGAAAPVLVDALTDQAAAHDDILSRVHRSLAETLETLDVEATLIQRWCARQIDPAAACRPVLYLPAARRDLRERLSACSDLSGIDIREGEADYPVIDLGGMVWTLQPKEGLTRLATDLLLECEKKAPARRRAESYAVALADRLRRDEIRKKLIQTERGAQ